jgi:hypothetical protein
LFHKHTSCTCIFVHSFRTCFCISFPTWYPHSVLGLSNVHLLCVFIFETLKWILVLFMHNTLQYHCSLNLTSLFFLCSYFKILPNDLILDSVPASSFLNTL